MRLLSTLFLLLPSCYSQFTFRDLTTLEEARVDGIVEVDNKVYILTSEDFDWWCDEPTSSYITELTLEGDVLRKSKIGEDGDISQALHVGPKPGTLLAMPGGSTQCHEHRSRCAKEISISTLQTLWKDERITTSNNACPPIGLSDGSVITATNRTIFKTGWGGSHVWNVSAELMEACVSVSPNEDRIYYVDRGETGDPIKVLSTVDGSLVDYLSDVNDPSDKCSGGQAVLSSDGHLIYQYRNNDGKNGRLAVLDAKNLTSQSAHNMPLTSRRDELGSSTAILSPDNRFMYYISDDATGGYTSVQCFDLSTSEPRAIHEWNYWHQSVQPEPPMLTKDGALFVFYEWKVIVVDTSAGHHLQVFPFPDESSHSCAYLNQNGHRLYMGSTVSGSQRANVLVVSWRSADADSSISGTKQEGAGSTDYKHVRGEDDDDFYTEPYPNHGSQDTVSTGYAAILVVFACVSMLMVKIVKPPTTFTAGLGGGSGGGTNTSAYFSYQTNSSTATDFTSHVTPTFTSSTNYGATESAQ